MRYPKLKLSSPYYPLFASSLDADSGIWHYISTSVSVLVSNWRQFKDLCWRLRSVVWISRASQVPPLFPTSSQKEKYRSGYLKVCSPSLFIYVFSPNLRWYTMAAYNPLPLMLTTARSSASQHSKVERQNTIWAHSLWNYPPRNCKHLRDICSMRWI